MIMKNCSHLLSVKSIKKSKAYECEECVKIDSEWVHLRTCQTCGVTLCCDSSIHQHARKHFNATQHPVITSAEPNEDWMYCYLDDAYLEKE